MLLFTSPVAIPLHVHTSHTHTHTPSWLHRFLLLTQGTKNPEFFPKHWNTSSFFRLNFSVLVFLYRNMSPWILYCHLLASYWFLYPLCTVSSSFLKNVNIYFENMLVWLLFVFAVFKLFILLKLCSPLGPVKISRVQKKKNFNKVPKN